MLIEQAGGDAERIRAVLKGLRAYQDATRLPRPAPMPEIAKRGRVRVLDYGGGGQRVLFVPSLINPPYVLDLAEDNSLLRWLAASGTAHPLLLDWGDVREDNANFTISGHVEEILLPLIGELGPDLALAGYCVGGTMALAAAARADLAGLALIAAPWNFDGYPEDMRSGLKDIWESGQPMAEALGLFPMELLQSAFWRLDPERTLSKFAAFGEMAPGSPEARAFVLLEDWANEGPPLPLPAARELMEDFFGANLPGTGQWRVGPRPIDPAAIACPIFNIISSSDKIVPVTTAPPIGEELLLSQGHVGMVIGSRAKAAMWQPLSAWLSHLRHS